MVGAGEGLPMRAPTCSSAKNFVPSTVGATVETSVSNKGEKWVEAFVLGRGLRPRWAEAGLRLRRAEVPERSALLSDKILCRRLQTEGR